VLSSTEYAIQGNFYSAPNLSTKENKSFYGLVSDFLRQILVQYLNFCVLPQTSSAQGRMTTCETMSRPVYLIIYHSPIFAAHWALWIPSYNKNVIGQSGKIINVQGSPSDGFVHEFERNYNLSAESRSHSLKLLGWVDPKSILDTACGDHSVDNTPIDALERSALDIQAPGPSLRHAGEPVSAQSLLISRLLLKYI